MIAWLVLKTFDLKSIGHGLKFFSQSSVVLDSLVLTFLSKMLNGVPPASWLLF